MAPHLCQSCVQVFEGNAPKLGVLVRYDDVYYIHRTYQSFAQSRQSNCRLCSDLWNSLASGISHPVEQLANAGLIVAFKVTYFPGSGMKPNWIFWMCSFYVKEAASSPAVLKNKYIQERLAVEPDRFLLAEEWYQLIYNKVYVLGKSVAGQDARSLEGIGRSSSSLPSRELVNDWVRSCVENHRECKPWRDLNSDVASPARILDVGDKNSAKIHLRRLDQDGFDDDYITLSYCKGKSKPLELNKSTVGKLQSGIDPRTLPKTFRNAVAVTRQLGVRYLWISSLCVFQDNETDRRIEGKKTCDIYGNSLLNIVASGAEDCDGGLFFEREQFLVQPLQVNMAWPVYQRHAIPAVPRTLYDCGVMGEWKEVVDSSGVNKRPWPLQEQFVSRRSLYCCKEQLFWECRRGRGNESYPNSVATAPEGGPIKEAREAVDRLAEKGSWKMTKTGKMDFQIPSDEKIVVEAYSQWTKLIEKFTACEVTLQDLLAHANSSITRAEDILLAFSGIARRFEVLLGDRYAGGLLLGGDFHNNLLWFTKELWPWTIRYPSKTATTQWKAPSWSWASVLGKVEWERPPLESDVLVKSTFLELISVQEESPVSKRDTNVPNNTCLHVKARKIALSIDLHRPLGSNLVDPGGMKAPLLWTGEKGSVVFGYGQLDDAAHLPLAATPESGGVQDAYIGFPVQYKLERADRDPLGQEKELKVIGLLVKPTSSYNDVSEGECVRRIGRFTLEIPILKNQNMLLEYLSELNNYQKGKKYVLV